MDNLIGSDARPLNKLAATILVGRACLCSPMDAMRMLEEHFGTDISTFHAQHLGDFIRDFYHTHKGKV